MSYDSTFFFTIEDLIRDFMDLSSGICFWPVPEHPLRQAIQSSVYIPMSIATTAWVQDHTRFNSPNSHTMCWVLAALLDFSTRNHSAAKAAKIFIIRGDPRRRMPSQLPQPPKLGLARQLVEILF